MLQTELSWHQPQQNLTHFAAQIETLPQTDLIVLPEMFTTGFSMSSAELAEPMDGPTVKWMQARAKRSGSTICGSVIVKEGIEDAHFYNRFLWVTPDSEVLHYDKRHLFRMSAENDNYSAGQDRKIFNINGISVLPQVCYDLRFPVFSRNQRDVDLIVYVANWPAARAMHWRTLLRARAIENQCHVLGINRVGTDGNGVHYCGDSQLIDAAGTILVDLLDRNTNATTTIDFGKQASYRDSFPAWKDADEFELTIGNEPTTGET